MKLIRPLAFILGGIGLLLLAGAALACTPAFQTWVARRILGSRPGWAVTVTRVSAGFGRVHLEGVRAVHSGAVLTLPGVDADLPLLAVALHNRLQVSRLVAKGWTLDLSRFQPPPARGGTGAARRQEFSLLASAYAAPAAPAAFAGIFDQLQSPVDLSLAGVDLAGDVLLPGPPAARAKVTVAGGALAVAHPGRFDYTATVVFEGADTPVRQVKVQGTLGLVMDTPRSLGRFVAATTADASGPKLPESVRLAVDISAARSGGGENYALALVSGAKQLAAVETSYAAGQNHLSGTWRLDLHDTDLAPFLLGREIPVFAAVGEGRYGVDTTFAELTASGRLEATAGRLGVVKPELAALGTIRLSADFDFAQRGDATRVDRLSVTLAGAKPVAAVRALQAFEFNPKTGELNVADPAKELLGVSFQGLPVAWVNPFLSPIGCVATGDDVQGEFAASARDGGFAIRPQSPLAIGNLTVTLGDGSVVLREVDVAVKGSADYTPQGWQVALAPLAVSRHRQPLGTLELKAGRLAGPDQPVKLAGHGSAQLPALLRRTDLDGALTAGEAKVEFVGNVAAKREFQLKLALADLASAAAGALPGVQAELRADIAADGNIAFNAPLRFERAGVRSDLTIAGTATTTGGKLALTAKISSANLKLDDVQACALPFLGPGGGAPVRADGTAVAAGPAWGDITGQCTLALKQVAYADELQVSDVAGVLRLEPAGLRLRDVRAGFGPDSSVQLTGDLDYQAASQPGYRLSADMALTNFEVGTVFRLRDPTRPPTVEGKVTLTGHLSGAGATLVDVAERTHGELKLTGKGGIFRALSADLSDKLQSQSRVVTIGSLFGVVSDDYVNKYRILTDIAKSLSGIPYDQLSLTATRDPGLNFVLKDFSLISPEIRIGGSGVVRHAAGVPVVAQPLEVQLSLGARGRLGDLIKRAGLLEAHVDSLGYAPFAVPLTLGGTLSRPDASAIRAALLNSALERSGVLDSLFGRGPK